MLSHANPCVICWLSDCREGCCYPPPICCSWLSVKVTELNLFVNYLPQLSMSASGEFVILCPQRQQEGRAGRVDRKLIMLGNCRPMGFKRFDSLLVPISGSIKPSKGPHIGLYLGQHQLQNSIRLCQVRTDWRENTAQHGSEPTGRLWTQNWWQSSLLPP